MRNSLFILLGVLSFAQFSEAKCNYECKSEKNKAAAQNFCNSQVGFECKVSSSRSCGSGWKDIKKFDDGGNSYFACIKTTKQENSDQNKKEAENYCSSNFSPGTCVVSEGGCGKNYKAAKHFRGPGKNYSACILSNRGEASEENKKEAEAFCGKINSSVGSLLECKVEKRNCSGRFKNVKEFKGKGDNYAACIDGK